MTGHRHKKHLDSKPAREIFLTSSSLSFSSLSSSTSWDDAVERQTKESTTSYEDSKGELSKASSQGSEMQATANVSTQPGPSAPPSRLRPVQLRNNGYDPSRIPESVFGKTKGDVTWSEVSNDSLFSLKIEGHRMSTCQPYRQSNLKPEEAFKSGEFLAYSPYISLKLEDAEEKISQVEEESKSGETSAETRSHQEKKASYSTTPPMILWNATPSSYCMLDQAPPKKERKKSKKKKKKNKCCIWSWLCSRFSKCCCFKGTKAKVS